MKLIVSFVVLWLVIICFALDSCDYISSGPQGAREQATSGVVVSGRWYQLSR